jgi:hypothetical protein
MTDHILRELWTIKDGLADECGRDLRRLFGKLKTAQKAGPRPIVNRTKPRSPAVTAR